LKTVRTKVLEIAYEEDGPSDGRPVMLLHGWPDAPRGWNTVAARLHANGWRTIVPYLRGSGPTRFLSSETPRVGSGIAMTQDAIDLADALRLDRFPVIGHDWGARIAYTLAACFPERITSITALALAFQPGGRFSIPAFDQARRFWYQWLMCVDGGAARIEADPVAFAHIQWETWSPAGRFDEREFAETARSFTNPDWAAISLNAYRSRWREGEAWDAGYDALRRQLSEIETLSTPTLMIQGAADFCDAPSESEGLEAHFTGKYKRMLIDGVGHFPHREAPETVAEAIIQHLRLHG
jgi:pimeloyl-ACP methyl ester carboxylesterase